MTTKRVLGCSDQVVEVRAAPFGSTRRVPMLLPIGVRQGAPRRSRASISSSWSSVSLNPLPSSSLIPLSGAGLCEALMMAAMDAPDEAARWAIPPDGMTPTSTVSTPTEWKPAWSAEDSISPERRVSRPMRAGP